MISYFYESQDEYLAYTPLHIGLDNAVSNIINEYSILRLEKEQMLNDVSTKSFVEGYGDARLSEEYKEIIQYFKEAEEGLIQKFLTWLKNIFDAILGRNNFKEELPPEEEIEVDGDPRGLMRNIRDIFNEIKKLLEKPAVKFVSRLTLAAAFITGGIAVADHINKTVEENNKKTKIKASEAKKLKEESEKIMSEVNNISENKLKGSDIDPENLSILDKLVKFITGLIDKFRNILAGGYNATVGKLTGKKITIKHKKGTDSSTDEKKTKDSDKSEVNKDVEIKDKPKEEKNEEQKSTGSSKLSAEELNHKSMTSFKKLYTEAINATIESVKSVKRVLSANIRTLNDMNINNTEFVSAANKKSLTAQISKIADRYYVVADESDRIIEGLKNNTDVNTEVFNVIYRTVDKNRANSTPDIAKMTIAELLIDRFKIKDFERKYNAIKKDDNELRLAYTNKKFSGNRAERMAITAITSYNKVENKAKEGADSFFNALNTVKNFITGKNKGVDVTAKAREIVPNKLNEQIKIKNRR